MNEGDRALYHLVSELCPAGVPEPALPDLAPLGVQSCRVCGCTDEFGCPEGCSWVEPDLCSSCTEEARA